MKITLLTLFSLISISAFSQNYPEYGLDKVRIADTDKTISAEIYPVNSKPSVKPDLYYYWYSANLIHSTQGGYSGRLLNGQYNEYYLNKSLKEQGTFKKGLKTGIWKSWNKDGKLNLMQTWKKGVIVTDESSVFRKLYFFKRKKAPFPPDTLSKKTL